MLYHLIHHLLHLFAANPHVHHVLIHHFRRQLPGMPRKWYPRYVRWLIRHYPRYMAHLLRHLLRASR
jgi:hypothetical protein